MKPSWELLASALAAVGASLCCVAPLVLVMVGVGGAWVSMLTALEPIRALLLALTFVLLGAAGWRVHRPGAACEPGGACADHAVRARQRRAFWLITIPVLALVGFPWYAPLFL